MSSVSLPNETNVRDLPIQLVGDSLSENTEYKVEMNAFTLEENP